MARIALNGKSRRKHGPVEVSRNKKKGGSKRLVCAMFRGFSTQSKIITKKRQGNGPAFIFFKSYLCCFLSVIINVEG